MPFYCISLNFPNTNPTSVSQNICGQHSCKYVESIKEVLINSDGGLFCIIRKWQTEYFHVLIKKNIGINLRKLYIWLGSDSQIDKQQYGHPKRAELSDVNINTSGTQSINTERAFFE